MAGERSQIPVDVSYAAAVGQAAYIFAYLEWGVVWCIERLSPSYVHTVSRKTAGQIANDFLSTSETALTGQIGAACVALADRFYFLVQRRNSLLHSNPGTASDGTQRLFRDGEAWSPEDIAEFSDDLAKLATEVNEFLHGELSNLQGSNK